MAALIDYLVPEDENPHEARGPEDIHGNGNGEFSSAKIKRSGVLFALAIGIHNFPEGIATFAAGLDSLTLGTSIALAVARATTSRKESPWPFLFTTAREAGKKPYSTPFCQAWRNPSARRSR